MKLHVCHLLWTSPNLNCRGVTISKEKWHYHTYASVQNRPDLEVIKFEYSRKLKIKRNDGRLRTLVRKQPIIAFYFEFENELKFNNLVARKWHNRWSGREKKLCVSTMALYKNAHTHQNSVINTWTISLLVFAVIISGNYVPITLKKHIIYLKHANQPERL